MRLIRNPRKVALSPRSWTTLRNNWSVRATRRARRGARSRARGSYPDKNKFAEALKWIRNDFTEESIAGARWWNCEGYPNDESNAKNNGERESEIYWALLLTIACKLCVGFWQVGLRCVLIFFYQLRECVCKCERASSIIFKIFDDLYEVWTRASSFDEGGYTFISFAKFIIKSEMSYVIIYMSFSIHLVFQSFLLWIYR